MRKRTVHIPHPQYQPSKAEKEEVVKLDVPGKTIEQRARNLAKVLLEPVNIQHEELTK